MLRLLIYLLVVVLAATGFAWLADHPGEIVLNWQQWRIETSLMAAIVGLIVLAVFIVLAWTLLRFLLRSPRTLGGFFRDRRRHRGYRALSRGMIAVGAGDAALARQCAQNAERLLSGEPLALLLRAQTAQLRGDHDEANAAFRAMLEDPETRVLGLHGLFVEAERAGNRAAAREYAAQAALAAPDLAWAGEALFGFQCAERDWDAALKTLQRNTDNRLLAKDTARRYRAVLLTAQALELEEDEPERALPLALEAHRLAPDLVPAAVVAGRLHAQAGDLRRATRVLEATWKLAPHPDIAEIYAHARPGDSARDRLKRIRTLNQKRPNTHEGALALAAAAIEARDFQEARQVLTTLLKTRPTQRACLLMADLEEAEYGDRGRVREWLARAVRAPRDPAWTADGYVSETWAPTSPITGRLDAFEWKVPLESLAAPREALGEEDFAPPAETTAAEKLVVIETPGAPGDAGDKGTEPAFPNGSATEPEKAPARISETPPSGEAAKPRSASPPNEDTAGNGKPVVKFPLDHAPDDPGPEPEPDESDRRFRLF